MRKEDKREKLGHSRERGKRRDGDREGSGGDFCVSGSVETDRQTDRDHCQAVVSPWSRGGVICDLNS